MPQHSSRKVGVIGNVDISTPPSARSRLITPFARSSKRSTRPPRSSTRASSIERIPSASIPRKHHLTATARSTPEGLERATYPFAAFRSRSHRVAGSPILSWVLHLVRHVISPGEHPSQLTHGQQHLLRICANQTVARPGLVTKAALAIPSCLTITVDRAVPLDGSRIT